MTARPSAPLRTVAHPTAAPIDPPTVPIPLPRAGRHRRPKEPAPPTTPGTTTPDEQPARIPPRAVSWALAAGSAAIGIGALVAIVGALPDGGEDSYPTSVLVAVLRAVVLLGTAGLAAGIAWSTVAALRPSTRPAPPGVVPSPAAVPALAASLAGAVLLAGAVSVDGQGLGVLVGIAAFVVLAAVAVRWSGTSGDPIAATRVLLPAVAVGCAIGALRALVEFAGGRAPGGMIGAVLLLATAAVVGWRRPASSGRRRRAVLAAAVVPHLLGLAAASSGDATGWVVLGLHLAVVAILFATAPGRARCGQEPLPGLVSLRRNLAGVLSSPGVAAPGTSGELAALLRRIPAWILLSVAAGAVVFVVGAVIAGGWSSETSSCTVAGGKRFALVEDTPECNAAFAGAGQGKTVMAVGALIVGGPVWWATRTRRRDPSTDDSTDGAEPTA